MPTRYLKPGIRDSERIEAVQDPDAEILFYRLLIVVDDFGRTDARPLMVKSACFPIRLRVNADNCMQWLQMLDAARLIGLYEVDGKAYLQVAKWDNKPRAAASKYPDPPADVYKRMQMLPVTVTETVTETGVRKPKPETGTKSMRASRLPVGIKILTDLGVEAQHAKDWLKVRNAKRAPLTDTALDDLKREAGKAGISVAEAVAICARRSWQGFNASWDWQGKGNGGNGRETVAEYNKRAAAEFLAKQEKTIEGERLDKR